jgi:hypothetical protein
MLPHKSLRGISGAVSNLIVTSTEEEEGGGEADEMKQRN